MYNRVILIGNLTRDPEVRYTPSGTAITKFDIAVNERYRDRNQELREETLFIRIETFQRQAETCAQYLKKGSRVFVEGKLREDSWEGQDGTKRSRMVVRGLMVRFLDPRPSEGGARGAAEQPAVPQEARSQPTPQPTPPPAPAEPEPAAPSSGVPEVDVNEPAFEPERENRGTDDDLPF